MKWFGRKGLTEKERARQAWLDALERAADRGEVALVEPDCVAVRPACEEYTTVTFCRNPLCPRAPNPHCFWIADEDKESAPCLVCQGADAEKGPMVYFRTHPNGSGWAHLSCLSTWVAEHPDAEPDVLRDAMAVLVVRGMMKDPYGGETGGGESA